MVGYNEDIALIVVAKHFEDSELYPCEATSAGLDIDTFSGKMEKLATLRKDVLTSTLDSKRYHIERLYTLVIW